MKKINFSEEEVKSLLFVIEKRIDSIRDVEISQPKFIKNEFYYPLFTTRGKLEKRETKFLKKEIEILKICLNNFEIKEEVMEINGFKKNRLVRPFSSAYKKL
ncbi:hypothetical protein JM80_0632 [Cellulophaga sp. RHA_52]|uniref:hypothetical protein n=1 Tax=Cellulophaga sp. RHA_52 TaxID=1250036 RepID=UPI00119A2C3D|nr:hypothetical protein [Cellulophaga sp. RHA_52]TVZ08148.1 hypothetical protein JM80_0632 [Cellulophaga sp. RHA_52]